MKQIDMYKTYETDLYIDLYCNVLNLTSYNDLMRFDNILQRVKTIGLKGRVWFCGWRYRNDPKFSDRYAWANTADPLGAV